MFRFVSINCCHILRYLASIVCKVILITTEFSTPWLITGRMRVSKIFGYLIFNIKLYLQNALSRLKIWQIFSIFLSITLFLPRLTHKSYNFSLLMKMRFQISRRDCGQFRIYRNTTRHVKYSTTCVVQLIIFYNHNSLIKFISICSHCIQNSLIIYLHYTYSNFTSHINKWYENLMIYQNKIYHVKMRNEMPPVLVKCPTYLHNINKRNKKRRTNSSFYIF